MPYRKSYKKRRFRRRTFKKTGFKRRRYTGAYRRRTRRKRNNALPVAGYVPRSIGSFPAKKLCKYRTTFHVAVDSDDALGPTKVMRLGLRKMYLTNSTGGSPYQIASSVPYGWFANAQQYGQYRVIGARINVQCLPAIENIDSSQNSDYYFGYLKGADNDDQGAPSSPILRDDIQTIPGMKYVHVNGLISSARSRSMSIGCNTTKMNHLKNYFDWDQSVNTVPTFGIQLNFPGDNIWVDFFWQSVDGIKNLVEGSYITGTIDWVTVWDDQRHTDPEP